MPSGLTLLATVSSPPAHSAGSGATPLVVAALAATLAVLLAGLVIGGPTLWRLLFAGPERRLAWWVGALTAAGFVVRLVLAPRAPMLSTYTGLEHMVTAAQLASGDWSGPFAGAYPLTVPGLAALWMALVGPSMEAFQAVSLVLSALLVPALYLVGRLLFERPAEGLVAATLGLLYPPLLTFAASGSLAGPYATLAALSVGLMLAWRLSGNRALLVAFLAALVLVLQTRLEAALFVLPAAALLAAAGGLGTPRLWRRSTWQWLAGFVLLAVPYLVSKGTALAGGTHGTPPAWDGALLAAARLSVVVGILWAWGRDEGQRGATTLRWAPVVLCAAWVLTVELGHGLAPFGGGPVEYPDRAGGETYTPFSLLFANPQLTPAAWTIAWFATAAALTVPKARGRWLALHVWLAVGLVAPHLKATGEFPFEGVRTSLPAAPAFLLLAAQGLCLGWQKWSSRWSRVLLVVLTVGSAAMPMTAALDQGFSQQEEFAFAAEVAHRLPAGSTLVLTDSVREAPATRGIGHLSRSRALWQALQLGQPGRIRVLSAATPAALTDLRRGGQPVFFFRGLDCLRQGANGGDKVCAAAARVGEALATRSFQHRAYNGDFLPALPVTEKRPTLSMDRLAPVTDKAHAIIAE